MQIAITGLYSHDEINKAALQDFCSVAQASISYRVWLGNCALISMNEYELKLEAPWEEVKETLQEINLHLTDEDLHYEKGKEKELLERLSKKLDKNIPDVKAWIESVSHNKGLAY